MSTRERPATKRDCAGCRDNFYNGNTGWEHGPSECWLLKSAVMRTRYRLSIHTPMNQREGYTKVWLPQCYQEQGYVFVAEIPGYARTRKQREADAKRGAR